MKDVDRRIEAIAQVNVESKEEKVERAEFKRANMWPHCSLSAVQRQTNSEPFPDLILVFYVEGEID